VATGSVGNLARDFSAASVRRAGPSERIVLEDLCPRPTYSVSAEPMCDAGLIRAVGEIDLGTVDALRRELDAAREEVATVVLDLSGVPFIDSTGLHLLLAASRNAAAADWALVVRPSVVVQRLRPETSSRYSIRARSMSLAKRPPRIGDDELGAGVRYGGPTQECGKPRKCEAFPRAADGIRTHDLLHGKQFVGLGDALNVAANGCVLAREQVPPMSSFQREITGISGLKPDSRQSSQQSCRRPQRVARPVAPMRRLGSGE
jgi:anti-anti-sigma factor